MSHVWSVALRLLPMLPTPSFAALSVRNAIDHAEDIHLLASLPASTAGPGFSLRSVSAPSFAARNARPRLDGIATTSDTEPQKVYNLSIERAQCYYANGILVHNCDTVTGALGYLRRNDLIKLKQEAEEEERESRRFKGNQQTIAEEYGIA
jgi:hypothetical protein